MNDKQVEQSKKKDHKADVLIMTALYKERKWVQKVFGTDWIDVEREGTVYQVCEHKVDDQVLRIVVVSQLQMGMPHAAILTTKSLMLWSPSLVIMTGICAGVKTKVELGDLIIATKVFDYGSGKVVGGKLRPHFEPVLIDSWLWQLLEIFRNDDLMRETIDQEYPLTEGRPEHPLVIRVGSLGSGAAVVADAEMVEGIVASERKLLGLDMESYAVALATSLSTTSSKRVESFIVKGVVDFADTGKDDTYHEYACYASAAFAKRFLDRYYTELVLDNK
ncbi:MAG: 5'-methylthioadenosine/S-adenosylhomocysteine nucleosidase [Chloroflexi bacterium]|nr:5'-methylthioadenosine/S-adenosylhomocysteine nucleosidase [Chloroflexota bacterium]